MANILITGNANGLGRELTLQLGSAGHTVHNYDLVYGNEVCNPKPEDLPAKIDVLINNAAVNHIDWLEEFEEDLWDDVMDTNAKGIYMMTRACLPMLKESRGTVLNIVSNAAHMPMTCSLAYNASKAAAHIMTLQLARELTRRHGITVFGIAPNKMSGTQMSRSIEEQVVRTRGWSREYAAEYQRNALLTGQETPPWAVAEFITFLLQTKRHHQYLSGCILPYGA